MAEVSTFSPITSPCLSSCNSPPAWDGFLEENVSGINLGDYYWVYKGAFCTSGFLVVVVLFCFKSYTIPTFQTIVLSLLSSTTAVD